MGTNPVIMPVHTGPAMTRRAVESVFAQDIPVTLILEDNGSEDCSAYLRSTVHRGAMLLSYHPAIGLHRAWNAALDIAFSSLGAQHALVVNNDVELSPWTYRMLLEDGGPFVTAVSTNGKLPDKIPTDIVRRPHPDFSCFLIRRETYETIGPFSELFHIYCGDADYHLRMHAEGIEAYCLNVPFYHECSGTLKAVSNSRRDAICKRADADRALFEGKWGCKVGSPEYYARFK